MLSSVIWPIRDDPLDLHAVQQIIELRFVVATRFAAGDSPLHTGPQYSYRSLLVAPP